jgi:hypothetical protein
VHVLPRCATGLLAGVLTLGCAGCSGGPSAALHVRLNAGPAVAAFDTPVHITVTGVPPGLVTLRAQTRDDQGRLWQSAAQFRVRAPGRLNLATAAPVSGSYHVADAAGLLWLLHPAFPSNPATQFFMGAAGFAVPLQVLSVGQVQASTTLVRSWSFATSPTVQTTARDGFASTVAATTAMWEI